MASSSFKPAATVKAKVTSKGQVTLPGNCGNASESKEAAALGSVSQSAVQFMLSRCI